MTNLITSYPITCIMVFNKNFYTLSKENEEVIEEFLKFKQAQKSTITPRTLTNIKEALRCLSNYFHPKDIRTLTEDGMISFFGDKKLFRNWRTRDTTATNIIQFYRWVYKLYKKERPTNLRFFEYTTPREKRKNKDINEKEKFLIEPLEYEKMLSWGHDVYGQTKAIWELYYLSGIRPEELPQLNLKDVHIDKDNTVIIKFIDSKSIPREIPLPSTPYKLLEYLEAHPGKNNKNNPLFFSLKDSDTFSRLEIAGIRQRFRKMVNELKLKDTLILKSFRKTRVTIVLNITMKERNLDYDDIGKIFCWTPKTIAERIQDYKLSDTEDLKRKYCKDIETIPSYQQQKQALDLIQTNDIIIKKEFEKENIELKQKISNLESDVRGMQKLIKQLESIVYEDLDKKIASEKHRQQLADEADKINKEYLPTNEKQKVARF